MENVVVVPNQLLGEFCNDRTLTFNELGSPLQKMVLVIDKNLYKRPVALEKSRINHNII